MRKYIFTESQIKNVIDSMITEQPGTFDFDEKVAINTGSKEFLDKKGIKGTDLTDRIKKYQTLIGCEDTGHMMDCLDTMYNKHRKDFEQWKLLIQKNKPLFDKIGDWFKRGFGVKQDPKSIY